MELDPVNVLPLPAGTRWTFVSSGRWRDTARGRSFSLPDSTVLTSPGSSQAWSVQRPAPTVNGPSSCRAQWPVVLLSDSAGSFEGWHLPVDSSPWHPRGQVSSKFRQHVTWATSWPSREPLCPPGGLDLSLMDSDCTFYLQILCSLELSFLLANQFPIILLRLMTLYSKHSLFTWLCVFCLLVGPWLIQVVSLQVILLRLKSENTWHLINMNREITKPGAKRNLLLYSVLGLSSKFHGMQEKRVNHTALFVSDTYEIYKY